MEIILNEQQEKAVKTDSKKVLCIASAGSGKTRCLVERIADLIENKQISPYEIMAMTFTRKAGQEMIKRLEERVGQKAQKITIGTMHAISLDFIQRFGDLIGLKSGKITVYNQFESDFLLKETAKDLGYHSGYKWIGVKKKDVYKVLNVYHMMPISDMAMEEYNKEMEILDSFFQRCKENNALTYDSILSTFLKLLPKIKQYLNFRHVFVDECQDNSPIQWDITNDIVKLSNASLFAVGDDSQSIYSFRGADPDYLIRNQDQFDIFKLEQNYRSDANIVYAANDLIQHNKNRLDLEMAPVKDMIVPVEYVPGVDSNVLCQTIPLLTTHKTVVLSRNHYLLEKLSTLLDQAKIKHEYLGKKTKLAHSEEFRRFHAFLKLIVNPFDNFAFLLIKDILGIDQAEYANIRIKASEQGKNHFQVWQTDYNFGLHDKFPWFRYNEAFNFDIIIDNMKDVEFPFDTESIFDFIYTWIIDNRESTIEQYLNWLTTYDIQDEIKKEPEQLQLMTVHAAKGLEWPTVIIAGLNEGIFPDKRSKKNDPNVEDERRLFYVAMTRAEDQLIMTSRPFKKDLFEIKNPASRFIKESIEEALNIVM